VTYDDDRAWRPRTGPDGGASTPDPSGIPPARPGDGSAHDDVDATSTDDVDVDQWFEASDDNAAVDSADLLGDDANGDGDGGSDDDAEPAPPPRRRGRKPKVTGGDPGLAIFVDSSALIALVDRDDSTHTAAVAAYGNLLAEGYKLFTTNYVIAETFDLLSTGVGPDVARRFLRDCKIAIYHADEQDERRAKRVVLRQTGPNGLSLTDAISFVVMERLNVADAFAVDPGFLSNAM
jgi:predicted nucleic acid-binding protein